MPFEGTRNYLSVSFKIQWLLVTFSDNMMDCLKTSDSFVAAGVTEVFLFFFHKFCAHNWQKETDRKLTFTEYKGLIAGYKAIDTLDFNIVLSTNYQILKIRLFA